MINAIAQQLTSAGLPNVESGLDIEEAMQRGHQRDVTFVFLRRDRAQENRTSGSVLQLHQLTFGVVWSVRAANKSHQLDALEARRDELLKALVGFQPPTASEPLQFLSGDLIGFKSGFIWWLDEFKTAAQRRNGVMP